MNVQVHRCHNWRALVLWLFVILCCSTLGRVCSVTAASIMLPAATRLITPITTPPPSTSLVLHPHSGVFIVSWKVGNVWNAFCICIYISVGCCANLYECDKSKSRVFVIRNVIFWDTTFGGWGAELGLDKLFVLETVGDPPDCREDHQYHHLDLATESEWCPVCPHPPLITLKVPSTNDNVMSCLVPGPLISDVRWVECLMSQPKG